MAPAARGAAQTGEQPVILFNLYAGVVSGPTLWHLRQPLCVWVTVTGGFQCEQSGPNLVFDTLDLSRKLGSGFTAGGGMTYFITPHLGAQVDFTYANEAVSSQCSPIRAFQPDPDNKNEQVCDDESIVDASLTTASLSGSLDLRPFPGTLFSPYVRLGGGLALTSGEVLAAGGNFVADGELLTRAIVRDSSGGGLQPFGTVALGIQFGSGNAPRFHVELSDLLMSVDRLTGPANLNGDAPRSSRLIHNVSLTVGLSMVFEGQRGHRY